MTETTIADIINNYKQQIDLYNHMLWLARQQLEMAENRSPMDKVLAERHRLMDDISSLNKRNQVWQESICRSMGMESFTVKNLQTAADGAVVEEMSQVLKEISQVLQQIEAVDQKIQEILNQQISPRNRPRATQQRAQQAYQKGTKPQT